MSQITLKMLILAKKYSKKMILHLLANRMKRIRVIAKT